MEEKYYVIQSGWSGDSMMFWREGRSGYTSNFDKVHKFTLEEAKRTVRDFERVFSWDELDRLTTRSVNPEIEPKVWDYLIEKQ